MDGYREFITRKESQEWGSLHYAEWGKKYKGHMRLFREYAIEELYASSVELYCGSYYEGINRFLRKKYDPSNDGRYRMLAEILGLVMCSAPKIPCNVVLYRIIDKKTMGIILEQNKLYAQYKELGFMSTSLLREIVDVNEVYARGEVLLKLYVPKGTLGIYVNEVTNRIEEEILLPPGLYIKIIKEPYVDTNSKKTVYECRVIDYRYNEFIED